MPKGECEPERSLDGRRRGAGRLLPACGGLAARRAAFAQRSGDGLIPYWPSRQSRRQPRGVRALRREPSGWAEDPGAGVSNWGLTLTAPRMSWSMSKHWERDLDNLQRHLMAMATSVEEAIAKGIRALQERNAALAEEVIAGNSRNRPRPGVRFFWQGSES